MIRFTWRIARIAQAASVSPDARKRRSSPRLVAQGALLIGSMRAASGRRVRFVLGK